MHEAVTWGAVLWVLLAVGGVAIVLGILFAILSAIGEGFKH